MGSKKSEAERLGSLTDRENQVLTLVSQGKTFKSIGRQLSIALSTVANHCTRIYEKLAVHRREQAIDLLRRVQRETMRVVQIDTLREWQNRLGIGSPVHADIERLIATS